MKVLHTFLINMRRPPPLLSFYLALVFLDFEIMMAVRDFVLKVFWLMHRWTNGVARLKSEKWENNNCVSKRGQQTQAPAYGTLDGREQGAGGQSITAAPFIKTFCLSKFLIKATFCCYFFDKIVRKCTHPMTNNEKAADIPFVCPCSVQLLRFPASLTPPCYGCWCYFLFGTGLWQRSWW